MERKGELNADTEGFFGLAFAKPFTEDGDLVMSSRDLVVIGVSYTGASVVVRLQSSKWSCSTRIQV